MKHRNPLKILAVLSAVFALFISGCRNQTSSVSSGSDSSTAVSENDNTVPTSVTGIYNGKTITLSYLLKTDMKIDNTVSSAFSQGYATVSCTENGKDNACFVDEKGNILGDALYRFAFPFDNEGRALVQKPDETWVYIDTSGKEVGKGQAPEAVGNADSTDKYDENGAFGVQDKDGNKLTQPIFEFIQSLSLSQNYAVLAQGEHRNVLINSQGEIVATLPDDCDGFLPLTGNVIACAHRDDEGQYQYRIMDHTGKMLSEGYYSAIGGFEDGLAPVTRDGKVGLIDEQGNVIIPPTFPMDDKGQISLGFNEGKFIGTLNGNLVIFSVTRD